MRTACLLCLCAGILVLASPGPALAIEVVTADPQPRFLRAPVDTAVSITFDRPVDRASVLNNDAIRAFGRWSGAAIGSYSFDMDDRRVTLTPTRNFTHGEPVMVIVSNSLVGADASSLPTGAYSYQFWTRSLPATNSFVEVERHTTRTTPTQPSTAYGGVATDVNGDGHLDLTIVNETTKDLRVFLNRADGSGTFLPFLQPTFPVGDRASPSEPSDFNGDGTADICVANIDDDTVSILLGVGDGTFNPQQVVAVGAAPRGIAVLDVDGDGDADIVNTNANQVGANLTLMLNDGSGTFGAATFFDSGLVGAWGLAASDMNADGLIDLVVASRDTRRIRVLTNDGDGTFTQLAQQIVGQSWMVVTGDVDADGDDDVSSINTFDDTGSILRNDGTGQLLPQESYTADPFGLATDLGDIDGDADLDWITSSFSGNWRLNLNAGNGTFTYDQDFEPTGASSCSLMFDADNDGDLDLALIDESADELIVLHNSSTPPARPAAVPAGSSGSTPLLASKASADGAQIAISWDVTSCAAAADHNLIWGFGSQLPSAPGAAFGLQGEDCTVTTSGTHTWVGSPDPSLDPTRVVWFLLTANDGAISEGSWGLDGPGDERVGPGMNGSSQSCGLTDKDTTESCGL